MQDVYAAFSEQLLRAQQGEVAVLNEDDGLLVRWTAICEDKLQQLSVDFNPDQVDAWTLERNTWQLVQALYSERLSETRRAESPSPASTSKNPYTPPITVVQKLIENDKDLIELAAIRDWLHSIPTSLNPAEIRRGYLPYTKNKLKQARRTGAPVPRGLVDELDPDAVLRGAGRLDEDDATYERALLRSLFEYVRAGELDLAIDMCRQSDQSWRAASLSGGNLWWDPSLAPGEDGYGDEMDVYGPGGLAEKRAKGVVNRRLWKMMCRKMAAAPNVDAYERALYGSISGDITSVLPVCNSWEDHLWAHVNALFESHLEAGLSTSSEGRFWIHGSVKDLVSGGAADVEDVLLGSAGKGAGIRKELEGVFERLLRVDKGELGAQAKNPLRVSQTYLILGKIGDLLTSFVERLEVSAGETEPETIAHLLRFFAHLILVLRLLKQPLPDYAANRILEAYVHVLEANDQDEDLIAFYASNLDSSSAIESYARFLLTFGPDSDRASRQAALLKAREHGLELAKIACRTVELILADIREELPVEEPSAFDAYARVDGRQLELIRSLEWLTFDHSTYPEALTQANALTRFFLSTDKPHAARDLLFKLPSDLLPSSAASEREEQTTQIREYLDYSAFFACLEKHTRFAEIWARKPRPGSSKLDQLQFRDGVATLVDDFYSAALDLLESDWLKLEGYGEDELEVERRAEELSQIRQLLIPHLVMTLHHTLYETSSIISSNLQRALDLANVVADERYQLYLEFVTERGGNKIGEYLAQVRLASLAALEGGNPLTVVASR
ncbi:nuclear pore complex protein Nup107 [Pseudohyphozyma bogoriensis]|nr:nuclear pore complex protein Nup107 [Pseudohyphozyma bogoriensis]